MRGPLRSSNAPQGSCASPYASEKAESSMPISVAFSPSSSRMVMLATESELRSR